MAKEALNGVWQFMLYLGWVFGIRNKLIRPFVRFSFMEEENVCGRLLEGVSAVSMNWAGLCVAIVWLSSSLYRGHYLSLQEWSELTHCLIPLSANYLF